jgi:hypothetical protein
VSGEETAMSWSLPQRSQAVLRLPEGYGGLPWGTAAGSLGRFVERRCDGQSRRCDRFLPLLFALRAFPVSPFLLVLFALTLGVSVSVFRDGSLRSSR